MRKGYTYPETIDKFFPPGWSDRKPCPICAGRDKVCAKCSGTGMVMPTEMKWRKPKH